MEPKTTEWRPGPSVCRCCLTEGCYKDISTEYFWMGKREVYAEMLSETLNITISYSQAGGPNSNSRLVCEPCISRLRDATDFKRQVLECEKTFMQHLDPSSSQDTDIPGPLDTFDADVKIERVKLEEKLSDDDFGDRDFPDDDDDDDLDDQPLMTLATKIPKKESVDLLDLLDNTKATIKRKSTSKAKASPAKKTKTVKRESAKASASKVSPKPEKKKKGDQHLDGDKGYNDTVENLLAVNATEPDDVIARRLTAALLLEFTRICPFRWTKNLYLCIYCNKHYTDPENLRSHNSEHSHLDSSQIKLAVNKSKKRELIKADITNVSCKLCNDAINDFASLKHHLFKKHNKEIDPDASDGILPFILKRDEFHCAICAEKHTEFISMNRHMNVHFQNYICEQCGSAFLTSERLQKHAVSHEKGSYPCDGCEKVYRSAHAKNSHYANVHMKVKRHRCPDCPETFRNYFQRNKHVSAVHGVKLKEFKCSMCPKVFLSSGKLNVHMKAVHLKMKRYSCDACEWKFYSKSELKEHMIKHGGERKYQCTVCKKSFARKFTLKEHMRIHENDRRYECRICGRTFVQNCSLKHHTKIHHPHEMSAVNVFT